uniref:Uncharacterized protein n=1 Tax=Cacopsylla melanoneura TaxID=428564 RepID=A0A8D8SAC5_9HEMI
MLYCHDQCHRSKLGRKKEEEEEGRERENGKHKNNLPGRDFLSHNDDGGNTKTSRQRERKREREREKGAETKWRGKDIFYTGCPKTPTGSKIIGCNLKFRTPCK